MLCPHWGSFDLDHPKITKNGRVFWRQTDSHPVVCKVQVHSSQTLKVSASRLILKYRSEEKGSSLCKCSILLGFFMSKKLERLRSELLSEDKITNLLGSLT